MSVRHTHTHALLRHGWGCGNPVGDEGGLLFSPQVFKPRRERGCTDILCLLIFGGALFLAVRARFREPDRKNERKKETESTHTERETAAWMIGRVYTHP